MKNTIINKNKTILTLLSVVMLTAALFAGCSNYWDTFSAKSEEAPGNASKIYLIDGSKFAAHLEYDILSDMGEYITVRFVQTRFSSSGNTVDISDCFQDSITTHPEPFALGSGKVWAIKNGTEVIIQTEGEKEISFVYAFGMFNGAYSNMKKITAIYIEDGDFSEAINLSGMFEDCTNLLSVGFRQPYAVGKNVSYRGMPTPNLQDIRYMFKGCSSLERISVCKEVDWSGVEHSEGMFEGCTSLKAYPSVDLVDGELFTFAPEKTDGEYAHVYSEEKPGYFTPYPL